MRRGTQIAAGVLGAAVAVWIALAWNIPRSVPGRLLPRGKLLVVVVPSSVAGSLTSAGDPSALVVSPPGRRAKDVFAQVSAGAPTVDATTSREGRPGALYEAFRKRGIGLEVAEVSSSARNPMLHLALDAFRRPADRTVTDDAPGLPEDVAEATSYQLVDFVDADAQVFVLTSRTVADVTGTAAWRERRAVLVIAVPPDLSAPLRITAPHGGGRVLGSPSTRRPGVVTAYDVAATIAEHAGVPFDSVGRSIHSLDRPAGRSYVGSIESRFRRDAGVSQSLTAWTVVVGIGAGFVAAGALVLAGRTRGAARLTTGASLATAGFLGGLFVPSPRGDVRALPVFAGLLLGIVMTPRDRARMVAKVFAAVAAVAAVLTIGAAANPGGEPALSLWGNPIVSSRYFGLQNYQAAFIAGGVVAAVALGLRRSGLVLLGVASAVVIGWPVLGANYVGVATVSFGAALAVLALGPGKPALRHAAGAGAAAVAAFVALLGAARVTGVGHGGSVAGEISGGGVSALMDVTLDRMRLNLQAIRNFPGGIVWTALFLVLLGSMVLWSRRDVVTGAALRVAVAAGASAAAAALVLEDSGFKTCAVLGFPALMLWTLQVERDPAAVLTALRGRRRARDDAGEPATPPPPRQR